MLLFPLSCHSRANGNPGSFPAKAGNSIKDYGFLLEFIPVKIGAGMTSFFDLITLRFFKGLN
jgi:hypothetical protein